MKRQALARWLGRVLLVSISLAARWGWADGGPCSAPSPAPPPPGRGRLVLAEYQVWHGSPPHSVAFKDPDWPYYPPIARAYDSRDPAVILAHIAKAKARGIDGFVVDWYGPGVPGLPNEADRAFMDEATCALFRVAEAQGFWVALLYDEGTVRGAGSYQDLVISDLRYGEQRYFSSPAYLRLEGRPALFVFPYDDVDPNLTWSAIRAALDNPVTLLDKDPDPIHAADFDGFYAWVQAVWNPDGKEWGEGYLRWFYPTMRREYASKFSVAGVWAGFDDSLVPPPWGNQRFISRQEGRVWGWAWALANEKQGRYPAMVMIATWNDFEEGTDVEFGVNMVVDMEDPMPDVLMRSSPFQVVWNDARGPLTLQVYRHGDLIHSQIHPPGVFLSLPSGHAYEVKLWVDGEHTLSKAVKIRRPDPIPSAVIVN